MAERLRTRARAKKGAGHPEKLRSGCCRTAAITFVTLSQNFVWDPAVTSRQPSSAERKRELKRERQRRWIANNASRRTCTIITIDERGLQALVWSGHLPDHLAHLKDEIRQSAQKAFDVFVAEERKRRGI